jgi:hypothetical protein
MCGDLRHEFDIHAFGPATRRDVSPEATRELVLISTDRKTQLHANVSPVTFHFSEVDCLRLAKRLSEIWVRIFFNECAKFGGGEGGHEGPGF